MGLGWGSALPEFLERLLKANVEVSLDLQDSLPLQQNAELPQQSFKGIENQNAGKKEGKNPVKLRHGVVDRATSRAHIEAPHNIHRGFGIEKAPPPVESQRTCNGEGSEWRVKMHDFTMCLELRAVACG